MVSSTEHSQGVALTYDEETDHVSMVAAKALETTKFVQLLIDHQAAIATFKNGELTHLFVDSLTSDQLFLNLYQKKLKIQDDSLKFRLNNSFTAIKLPSIYGILFWAFLRGEKSDKDCTLTIEGEEIIYTEKPVKKLRARKRSFCLIL